MPNSRNKFGYISCILVGSVGYWLFVSHLIHFHHASDVIVGYQVYCGVNIVSRWADFGYFSYHSLLFFCTWSILFGMARLFGWHKIADFLCKSTVLSFLMCNYCLTTALYTVFELSAKPITFGLWEKSPLAIHNLGTNLIVHYLFFVFVLIAYIRVVPTYGRVWVGSVAALGYLGLYCVSVKLSGEYAYQIRWFPYIIFDLQSFSEFLGINQGWSIVLLVLVFVILFATYFTLYFVFFRLKNKRAR